jgi:hypothetical protein
MEFDGVQKGLFGAGAGFDEDEVCTHFGAVDLERTEVPVAGHRVLQLLGFVVKIPLFICRKVVDDGYGPPHKFTFK